MSTLQAFDLGRRVEPASPVVSAYNEWDPLEEVIVGVVDHAAVPTWHVSIRASVPQDQQDFYVRNGGRPFPPERVALAKQELDAFAHVLEAEGVKVRRPELRDHTRSFRTPDWESRSGLYAAMPRDVLLVLGDEIIESPMAWRSRYFEPHAYRALLKEYFLQGARWTAAPKPELADALYDEDFVDPKEGEPLRYAITEFEPTFDAADFMRFGKDLVVQKSNVTNAFGIEWLKRHVGDRFNVHLVEFADTHPMHIDASILPLAAGRLLINPERVPQVPALFKHWEILPAPQPCIPDSHPLWMTSKWINMNMLSLDEERVIVEKEDAPMIAALKAWGFKPIPVAFRNFNSFGGSFHCATADVRRRGTLRSYLD